MSGHWLRHINLSELNKQRTGFTIIELIVVIVILAVIAVISLPGFNKMKENSLDQEAIANLKLIQAAEKVYKLEMTTYFNGTDASGLNTNLTLALPTTGANWNYTVYNANETVFTANATRAGGTRFIWINQSANDTVSSGT